jgi:hypothetical protein
MRRWGKSSTATPCDRNGTRPAVDRQEDAVECEDRPKCDRHDREVLVRNRGKRLGLGVAAIGLALASSGTWAVADDDNAGGDGDRGGSISEQLTGYEET